MKNSKKNIAIIGGGPSGLMAAEILASAGHNVTIYDRMPSLGRKFLMAGRGGLNLTHSEPLPDLIKKYGKASGWIEKYIKAFTPDDLKAWCEALGQETFIGSSGRVFPKAMKAAPLLRAWLRKLDGVGVKYFAQHMWLGFESDSLKFANAKGEMILVQADATLLALGGASWPRLGSDGTWTKILSELGVNIAPLKPSNCGFITEWSEHFSSKFAGTPLKPVALTHNGISHTGEAMITKTGIEGGVVYAISAELREEIAKSGSAVLKIDLKPDLTSATLTKKLEAPRGDQSFSNYLRKAGVPPVAIGLIRENISQDKLTALSPYALAKRIKEMQVKLTGTTGLARAISTAGGIEQSALDNNFMLVKKPGVFATGEMLDWEAPTGGYLLQACFSLAVAAANGMVEFLGE